MKKAIKKADTIKKIAHPESKNEVKRNIEVEKIFISIGESGVNSKTLLYITFKPYLAYYELRHINFNEETGNKQEWQPV